jgi:hypothetical protein
MKLVLVIVFIGLLISHSIGQTLSGKSFKEANDILYVEKSKIENDSLQRLNIILPVGSKDYPLLIWIGGGAWSYVNRNMEMDLGRKFAEKEIAFASIGHRLSSAIWKDTTLSHGVRHPAHIRDVAAAFKWLYDNASNFEYRKDRIFVGGFSSGAHLAALLAMDGSYLKEVGLSPDKIKGIIPIAGAYDILNYYNVFLNSETNNAMADTHVKAVFGETENDFIAASPTSFINNLSTPMLLLSENNTYNYTKIFEDKIRATSYRNFQVIHVHRMGHGELWKHLSYDENSIYRDFIVNFIKTMP